MLRHSFEQRLQLLRSEVLLLGHRVGLALEAAITALAEQDGQWAQEFLGERSGLLNEKYLAIEAETLSLIATQQPVAGDLRNLVAILEIITELDHVSQYAAGAAQTTLALKTERLPGECRDFVLLMSAKVRAMLEQSLLAFEQHDAILARTVPAQDDEVDQLYAQLSRALVSTVKAEPQSANQATAISRTAHHLERTADRVINICEWVIFAVTGEMKELNVSAIDPSRF